MHKMTKNPNKHHKFHYTVKRYIIIIIINEYHYRNLSLANCFKAIPSVCNCSSILVYVNSVLHPWLSGGLFRSLVDCLETCSIVCFTIPSTVCSNSSRQIVFTRGRKVFLCVQNLWTLRLPTQTLYVLSLLIYNHQILTTCTLR